MGAAVEPGSDFGVSDGEGRERGNLGSGGVSPPSALQHALAPWRARRGGAA
jgi:hypothetical protein